MGTTSNEPSSNHRGRVNCIPKYLVWSPGGRLLFGHVQFVIERTHSIRAIFSHTNITGRAIPIYRSDSVSLPTHHHFSESHRNFETQDRAKVKGSCWVRKDWLSDSLRAGSAELRGWLTAAVLRDLDRAWTLKSTEQDEKHTVQRSKLEPKATVTIIKYCVCHYVILSVIAALS